MEKEPMRFFMGLLQYCVSAGNRLVVIQRRLHGAVMRRVFRFEKR